MYLGIVIQNNDPDYRGRVKVYVPHIQANIYQKWFKEISDKKFKFIGSNIDSDLSRILPELKTILPWAENAMPSVGSAGSGRYNAHDDIGKVIERIHKIEHDLFPYIIKLICDNLITLDSNEILYSDDIELNDKNIIYKKYDV